VDGAEEAARAVELGQAVSVDLGVVRADKGRELVFLNTFSIGAYPELVRAREQLEGVVGKWPALAIGLARVLARGRPMEVEVGGRRRRLWLLFAGNGVYQPPGFAPSHRTRLDDGLLDVRAVDGSAPFARTRLLCAVLTGTLDSSRVLVSAPVRRLHLGGLGAAPHFACDGELHPAGERLDLAKWPRALTVYRPWRGGEPGVRRARPRGC
jgi:undecaprenyl-diphosphatase